MIMANFVNLTPHAINLNDGRVFPPSGVVARVSSSHSPFDGDGVATLTFGDVVGLPVQQDGVLLITSALVAQAAKRQDVVSPATGHHDCVRNDKGHIVSVPGFVRG
jgi:hypothetical protein